MSLEKLLEPIPEPEVKLCKVGQTLANLDEPYRSALQGLLSRPYRDGGYTDEVLQRRMTEAGLPMSVSIINRHRRAVCNCAVR